MHSAAAIGNAFYNATGVRMRSLPMTPPHVLAALGNADRESAGMNSFTFVDCTTVDDALASMDHGAVVKAGGIDLLDLMKDGIATPPTLINIRQIKDLHGVTLSNEGLTIGPLTTLTEIQPIPSFGKSTALSPTRPGTPPRRRSATWRLSAEIFCSGRAAGISAPPSSIALEKAARFATRKMEKTSTTPL